MHNDPLYPPPKAAEYLGGFAEPTLAWWRCKGRGPHYLRIEGRIFYRQSALDAFIAQSAVDPAGEAA